MLKILNNNYKIGLNEVVGLEAELRKLMEPVQKSLKDKVYWNDCELETVEYTRRDGFIPHSHNCGGLETSVVLPKCEEYNFCSIEFGECDDSECECRNEDGSGECPYECNGDLDAFFRVRLKFEGLDQNNVMKFYLFAEGGNNDAPYFRDVPTLFESEFTAKNFKELQLRGAKHIKKLIKEVLK